MRRGLAIAAALAGLTAATAADKERPAAAAGDPDRGRVIVSARETSCVLCHEVPQSGIPLMGNVGPPLAGVGARLSESALRARIVDSSRLDPDTIMPSYHRVDGLRRVAPEYRGKPVLSAAEVEDVVAFLGTLR